MIGRGVWRFQAERLPLAQRTPPLPEDQLVALNDLAIDFGPTSASVGRYADEWRDFMQQPGDDFVGTSVSFTLDGDQVRLHPLYDQWGDRDEVVVPVALVQELLDQYRAWLERRG